MGVGVGVGVVMGGPTTKTQHITQFQLELEPERIKRY